MTEYPNQNFIEEFVKEIAQEAGMVLDGSDISKKALEALEQRVLARAFLEIVGILTPEQAKSVKEDMEKEGAGMNRLLAKLSQEVPDFQLKMAQILAGIKMELIEDLKKANQ